jgi:hypothetical protein
LLSPFWDDDNDDDDDIIIIISFSKDCSLTIKHNDMPLHTFCTFNLQEYPTIARKALTVLMQYATSANLYFITYIHDVQKK